MIYPILIKKTKRDTVIAVCPILHKFYTEGTDTEDALRKLKDKFLCYIHDDNVQLEIIAADGRGQMSEDRSQMSDDRGQ